MNKEDVQNLKDILKVLEKAEFNKQSLMDQMKNAAYMQKYSAVVAKLEKSLEAKPVETKNEIKQGKTGSK